jgi:hypothetical protein
MVERDSAAGAAQHSSAGYIQAKRKATARIVIDTNVASVLAISLFSFNLIFYTSGSEPKFTFVTRRAFLKKEARLLMDE